MIIKANIEEAKSIYMEYMIKDFPDDEIPDFNRFMKLTIENKQTVYLYKKDNKNVAYFITTEEDENVLITHLAVIKNYRSMGIGKVFIEEIKSFLKNKKLIIVEVENEKRANNSEELEVIKRRRKYYINAGFKKCEKIQYNLYGVDYDILIFEERKTEKYDDNEIINIIKKIYRKFDIDERKLIIDVI